MLKPFYKINTIEAGCDEAGRGCIAGPVYAAAVILPENYKNELITDSKIISKKDRELLRKTIIEDSISWAVASVDNHEIDDINILNASIKAMHLALDKLRKTPEHLIIDGNRFHSYKKISHTCIIKGDSKYLSIAAASILAKTFRDDYMLELHQLFPQYHWNKNKGYPTFAHREAIIKTGITNYHRKSFRLLSDQTKIKFD